MKQTRVRLPHRLTPLIMIHYLSPPSAAPTLVDSDSQTSDEKERRKDGSGGSDGKDKERIIDVDSDEEQKSQGSQGFSSIPSDIPKELAYVFSSSSQNSYLLLANFRQQTPFALHPRRMGYVCARNHGSFSGLSPNLRLRSRKHLEEEVGVFLVRNYHEEVHQVLANRRTQVQLLL